MKENKQEKYNEIFKYIEAQAKQDFTDQYKITKNDYLKKIPLSAQLIAKYKMDDQLNQLWLPVKFKMKSNQRFKTK